MEKDWERAVQTLKFTTERKTWGASGGITMAYESQHVQVPAMGLASGRGISSKRVRKIRPPISKTKMKHLYGL